MDLMKIMNNFKKETIYEFSEAVPLINNKLYIIFKTDIISIDMNPSRSKKDKLKKIIRNIEDSKSSISHLEVEPIAYLLETENNEKSNYQIEAIEEKYEKIVKENEKELLKQFLEEKN